MSIRSEHVSGNESQGVKPQLSEVIGEFDGRDLDVRMAYSRYFEKPHPKRMKEINRTSSELFDAFSEVLETTERDTYGVLDEEAKPAALATVIHRMCSNHSELIAEYSDTIALPTEEESQIALETLMSRLEDLATQDFKQMTVAALDHFREALSDDMDVIEYFSQTRIDSPMEKLKRKTFDGSIEAAKIGAGVLLGIFVYDRIKRS